MFMLLLLMMSIIINVFWAQLVFSRVLGFWGSGVLGFWGSGVLGFWGSGVNLYFL